jgi:peptide/nickel transport system ATP-binding protein
LSALASPLLSVSSLTVSFGEVSPVRSVSFSIERGQRVGLVGESGSGKSLTSLAITRLIRPPGVIGGRVKLDGVDLLTLSPKEIAGVRGGRIALVYQDPMSSLNPVHTVGEQIVEAIRTHLPLSKADAEKRTVELLAEVGIPDPAGRAGSYPHQFSGGMRQRAMIAMALAAEPDLLIADEPTTALDVTTQARIVELLNRLVDDHGLAVIFITHDLGVAAGFCDDILVMYAGRIVERGDVGTVFAQPAHPYTRALLDSICRIDLDVDMPIAAIPGQPPLPDSLPSGCAFHPRCPLAFDRCAAETPPPEQLGEAWVAECHLAGERTAEVPA